MMLLFLSQSERLSFLMDPSESVSLQGQLFAVCVNAEDAFLPDRHNVGPPGACP